MYEKVSTDLNFVAREKKQGKDVLYIHFMTGLLLLMENHI